MDRLAIGIDTGGTFTDGVLLQYKTRKILRTAKTLTTKSDLKNGVIDAIEKLGIESPEKVKLVGISSTLATNSIAVGNARKVGLLLIGYDKSMIEKFGLAGKLSTETVEYFEGGHTSQGEQKEDLDLEGIQKWVRENQAGVDALAVSSYFSPLNSEHEDRAFTAIKEICDIPVVMGHQLSTHLDSIRRAATASLNASLVSVMHEFISAVQESLKTQQIKAPLMIVRGDGTLMPYKEAIQKPVETVLSGPAASAIGGDFITGKHSSLVIDMGSTTTDMALVDSGRVVVSQDGARVGDTRTSVEAACIRTVCVGCDSRIEIDKYGKISVGPEKVVPLCQFASRFPEVKNGIMNMKNRAQNTWKVNDLEYWNLYKHHNCHKGEVLSDRAESVIELLKEGPRSVSDLMSELNVYHSSQLERDQLIRQGIVEVSSVTPSDILHAKEDMELWDDEAAHQSIRCFARIHEIKSHDFIEGALAYVIRLIAEEAMIFLASQDVSESKMPERIEGKWGKWLLEELFTDESKYLSVNIDSRFPVTGTGAPAEYFINHVAKIFSAPFVLPKHYEVANAIGAVAGSIMEVRDARIFEQVREETHTYILQQSEEHLSFDDYDDACDYAEEMCRKKALDSVLEAGASDPYLEVKTKVEGSITRIIVRAVGNPRISE
ncbi:MAG: hydantoinase/oxoprolinase family protein [Chitinivibrionales bacterium]